MNIPGLTNAFRAGGAIAKHRILAHGSADGVAIQAVGAAAPLLGISTDIPTDSGAIVDAIRNQLAPVEYGGTVIRGAPLTADSDGRAIATTLASATVTYIIGFAEVEGVVGDIGSVNVVPGVIPATTV